MSESFEINMYFDEKGEEIEKLISNFLVNKLEFLSSIERRTNA